MVICKYMSKFEYFFFLTRRLLQILTLLGFINISQSVMEAKVV